MRLYIFVQPLFFSMKNILIIGCGRLGSALYRMFKAQGGLHVKIYDTAGFNNQDKAYLREDDFYSELNETIIRPAELLIISVPDDHIPDAAHALLPFDLDGKIILHTSGLHSSQTIRFLEDKGAFIGSLHPLQTFSSRFSDTALWKKTWCTFEGSARATSVAEALCLKAGARFLRVNGAQKKALHTAAVFTANYSAALFAAAEKILTEFRLDKQLLLPLLRQMYKNFEQKPAHQILSGPLQRGDSETASAHLKFLLENGFENEEILYRELAAYILSDPGFKIENLEDLKKALKQK